MSCPKPSAARMRSSQRSGALDRRSRRHGGAGLRADGCPTSRFPVGLSRKLRSRVNRWTLDRHGPARSPGSEVSAGGAVAPASAGRRQIWPERRGPLSYPPLSPAAGKDERHGVMTFPNDDAGARRAQMAATAARRCGREARPNLVGLHGAGNSRGGLGLVALFWPTASIGHFLRVVGLFLLADGVTTLAVLLLGGDRGSGLIHAIISLGTGAALLFLPGTSCRRRWRDAAGSIASTADDQERPPSGAEAPLPESEHAALSGTGPNLFKG